jgi:hypothetical protein
VELVEVGPVTPPPEIAERLLPRRSGLLGCWVGGNRLKGCELQRPLRWRPSAGRSSRLRLACGCRCAKPARRPAATVPGEPLLAAYDPGQPYLQWTSRCAGTRSSGQGPGAPYGPSSTRGGQRRSRSLCRTRGSGSGSSTAVPATPARTPDRRRPVAAPGRVQGLGRARARRSPGPRRSRRRLGDGGGRELSRSTCATQPMMPGVRVLGRLVTRLAPPVCGRSAEPCQFSRLLERPARRGGQEAW